MANRDGVAGKIARKDLKGKRNNEKGFEKERKRNKIKTVKGSNRKGGLTEKKWMKNNKGKGYENMAENVRQENKNENICILYIYTNDAKNEEEKGG
jgi:hypothetical protein